LAAERVAAGDAQLDHIARAQGEPRAEAQTLSPVEAGRVRGGSEVEPEGGEAAHHAVLDDLAYLGLDLLERRGRGEPLLLEIVEQPALEREGRAHGGRERADPPSGEHGL